jgi:pSer/pThr/pTyr-binding forkhead associated (FHA) protein
MTEGSQQARESSVTLTLVHPSRGTTLQLWTFSDKSLIRIGRSKDNDVVVPNEVVSRYHAELRFESGVWELAGFGTNGTLVDGKVVTKATLGENQVITLAPSGPALRFATGGKPLLTADQTQIATHLPGLIIDVDEGKKERQVAEIANSDYFQQLQQRTSGLRTRKPTP